jgi:hypothetical protein
MLAYQTGLSLLAALECPGAGVSVNFGKNNSKNKCNFLCSPPTGLSLLAKTNKCNFRLRDFHAEFSIEKWGRHGDFDKFGSALVAKSRVRHGCQSCNGGEFFAAAASARPR